jgi:AcrR family transcriptional regulator
MYPYASAYAVRLQAVPRPRSLTPAAIAAAALAVLDRDGPAGLSMRAVAAELGTGTMSLYRYVADRAELELLVVDLVLAAAGPDTAAERRLPWQDRITGLAERARQAITAHPAVIPLLLAHRHAAPNSWRWSEAVLAALTEAGLSGQRRAIALRCLVAYITGTLQAQYLGPLAGPGTTALAALPPAAYPLLAETAQHARGIPPEQEFRQGLDIVLGGLRAMLTDDAR